MANQQIDPTKTRKDAQIFTVTDPADAIGYYLAEDLTKTWQEDFADGDSGEVITINRREIIKRRGELVTADLASSLIFYIQTGDVTEIKVSDQRRQALEYNNTRLKPYKVTAIINSKRHQFILEAQTVELAMEVARDWIELNYNGDFTIIGVAALQNVVLLNSTLERTNDETGESEEISGSGEADGETTRYYKAEGSQNRATQTNAGALVNKTDSTDNTARLEKKDDQKTETKEQKKASSMPTIYVIFLCVAGAVLILTGISKKR